MPPRTMLSDVSARPRMASEPTRLMAEMALVSDINGVCKSGETRLMTSRPRNVARRNTNRLGI